LFIFYKDKINDNLLFKNLIVCVYIFSFTIVTPLLGGRQFLQFDIQALSVFSSTYVMFLFIWISLPFIFKELRFFNQGLKLFLYGIVFLNIFSSFSLKNDYLNSESLYLSEADESVIYKEEIVDFLASKSDKSIQIYYDLGGDIYNWIPDFNENNYTSDYYMNSFSLGRDFDYLLKKKYNIDNSQEGNINRTYENTDFYIGYNFEEFPYYVYEDFKHYEIGNYRVTENLAKNE
jgi:hypothetical protein